MDPTTAPVDTPAPVCPFTGQESFGYLVLFVLAAAVGLVLFLLVWRPARKLLSANDRLLAARPFFIRTLFLLIMIGAIAPVIGETAGAGADAAFMEHVWQAAGQLQETVIFSGLYLFGFVLVLTILAASLGRFRDE